MAETSTSHPYTFASSVDIAYRSTRFARSCAKLVATDHHCKQFIQRVHYLIFIILRAVEQVEFLERASVLNWTPGVNDPRPPGERDKR